MTFASWRHDRWETFAEKAKIEHAYGNFRGAQFYYHIALSLASLGAAQAAELGRIYLLEGELYLANGYYKRAERSLKRAAQIYGGEEAHVDMSIVLSELSETLQLQGKADEAALCHGMAAHYIERSRQNLENCFQIPAA